MNTANNHSDYVVPPIGGTGTCRACGRRGKRVRNVPDAPGDVQPDGLACSSDCAKRIMSREFGPWRCIGWIK